MKGAIRAKKEAKKKWATSGRQEDRDGLEKAHDIVPRQEVWRCMREKAVLEKYLRIVKDTYVEARTNVKNSVWLTSTITVRVGLHQGTSLSPYLFDLIMDVLGRGIKE